MQGITWYEIIFIVGEGKEAKTYNESLIVEMIQRLELIGEDQLIKAFEKKQA